MSIGFISTFYAIVEFTFWFSSRRTNCNPATIFKIVFQNIRLNKAFEFFSLSIFFNDGFFVIFKTYYWYSSNFSQSISS